ncbi:segregation/condensation protein A [Thermosipho ferrireducens]|uniref:Segregation and condensation protein A n=1 Tax=Thermosipho ferrireducens TaxID=2571116 RepID=A0ABX7S845_9BACT|nr:ScpA family protein [Thermosipho ferrireducens]QTA38756.1 segregation/condensation protein A [Thermosipho ferrireducens]
MEVIFRFEKFEGPLDLILFLVKKKQISIREIPISQLADEFLSYIERMKRMNLSIASEFIVTASYLMELKSRSLLPRSNVDPELQAKKERFYTQVEQYAKLKEYVEKVKNVDPSTIKRFPVNVQVIFPKINEKRLKKIISSVVHEIEIKKKVYEIKREELLVENVMDEILENWLDNDIYSILKVSQSKYELIVRFLAVLELIRLGYALLDEEFILKRVVKNGQKANSNG